jgi:hypothetical protein
VGLRELRVLVDRAGGVDALASYVQLEPAVLEEALRAPDGAWSERVSAMVAENTEKLLLMPSQFGFFWRLTRKRVAKDWLLLARWSQTRR